MRTPEASFGRSQMIMEEKSSERMPLYTTEVDCVSSVRHR